MDETSAAGGQQLTPWPPLLLLPPQHSPALPSPTGSARLKHRPVPAFPIWAPASCVDLLTALYWQEMRIDPQAPAAPDRDRCAEQRPWSTRAVPGAGGTRLFPTERLAEFGKPGSVFHEHPQAWLHPRRGSSHVPWVTVYRWPLAWPLPNASKAATAVATPS